MNTNQYTQKTLEALQAAQQLAVEYQHNQLEPEHLLHALASQEQGLIPQLLQKLNVDPGSFAAAVAEKLSALPRVSGSGRDPDKVYISQAADKVLSAAALKLIRENLELCGLSDRARVRNGDSLAYLRSGEKFDLVFLDPPYDTGLLEQALQDIAGFDICREHGIIMAESPADAVLPPLAAPYRLYREYRYGRIKLTVYHRQGNEE